MSETISSNTNPNVSINTTAVNSNLTSEISPEEKRRQERMEVLKKFARKPGDTGSPEVQIALLTYRINSLSPHFEQHQKDFHSKRGLLKMIARRKSLLKYLSSEDNERYKEIIKSLGLRK